jgi:hypothetical protein
VATSRQPDSEEAVRAGDWSLLLHACRADTSGLSTAVAERFPGRRASDWTGFLALMDQQGVGVLAATALLSVAADLLPEDIRAALRERIQLGALRAGIHVPELLAILEALEARRVATIAYKGETLSMLAYGRMGVRESVDLDLVVRESDVTAAEEVLCARGYRRSSPGVLRPRVEAAWRKAWNETEFISGDGWVVVDLHWRAYAARYPFRIDPTRLWSRTAPMTLRGREVPVFRAETLLGLLCLHGAKDEWHKLIWLCDVDRLIRVSPSLDWEEIRSFAEEGRCRRVVGLGLLLARRLFETPLPVPVLARLAEDEDLVRLVSRVEKALATGGITRSWWLGIIDVWPFHLEVFDSWRDGALYVGRTLVTPLAWDWELLEVRLPDSLYGLYYVLRPLRLLATLVRESLRRGLRLEGR